MLKKGLFIVFFLGGMYLFLDAELMAQCAMCKENLKNDIQTGGGVGKNINNAILYIMVIPYILIFIVGYILYKNYKKEQPKSAR